MKDMNVLFVDDEESTLHAIQRLLRRESYSCHFAGGGEEALCLMDALPVQILITDIRMPEMDGLTLLKEVKLRHPDTVRLALSAYTDVNQVLPCINTGEIFRYITKPVDPEDLRNVIREAMDFFLLRKDRLELVNELHEKNVLLKEALEEQRKTQELLEQQAIVDELTSLYNRRHLNTFMKEQFEVCQRYDDDMTCLMMDLDHFKKVNDVYGHDFGDFVLAEFARRLKTATRKSDYRFRYGGEEFIVILPKTSLEQGVVFADRILQVCRSTEFASDGRSTRVTASIGAVSLKNNNPYDPESMVKMADERLYRAKETGRDRVVRDL